MKHATKKVHFHACLSQLFGLVEETSDRWVVTKERVFTLLSLGASMHKRSALTFCCTDEHDCSFPIGKAPLHDSLSVF